MTVNIICRYRRCQHNAINKRQSVSTGARINMGIFISGVGDQYPQTRGEFVLLLSFKRQQMNCSSMLWYWFWVCLPMMDVECLFAVYVVSLLTVRAGKQWRSLPAEFHWRTLFFRQTRSKSRRFPSTSAGTSRWLVPWRTAATSSGCWRGSATSRTASPCKRTGRCSWRKSARTTRVSIPVPRRTSSNTMLVIPGCKSSLEVSAKACVVFVWFLIKDEV